MTLNAADPTFLQSLSTRLPKGTLKDVEPRYLEEPRGKFNGRAGAVALPRNAAEVSTIVKACNAARVGLVPYGGGTGLVGGQVAWDEPVPLLLSLERMSAVRGVFPEENVMTVEAGMILEDVQRAAEEAHRLFPLSLAAQGSCQIGGNLACNAGGVNVLRYGNARDLCLGLEAVLPNGEIWHGLTRLRKDNTGYDLRNLLVGSEGTLGIITAASLKLFARSVNEGTALIAVPGVEAALALLALVRSKVGEAVSAFELIHKQGVEFIKETLPDLRIPFADVPEWSVLIELGLGAGLDPQKMLETIFSEAFAEGLTQDGVIAQSLSQRAELWSLREHIPIANKHIGSISSHDISVPISAIPAFVEKGRQVIAEIGDFRINAFGHLGDGNLHYNVFPPKGKSREAYADVSGRIKEAVHDLVHRYEGSFSAEHGVGRLKTADMARYGDPTKLAAMRAIKEALDPNGIMNPGVVLPR